MNALEFIVGYTVFFIFASYIFLQMGVTVFSNVPSVQAMTCSIQSWTCSVGDYLCGLGGFLWWVAQMVGCFINGVQLLFTFMTLDASFGIVGTILVAAFVIGLIYIIINLVPFVGGTI
jgi:hypothetical protein